LDDDFDSPLLDSRLAWYCEPERWCIQDSDLVIEPAAKTDYWQRTHYGFSADNGHFLYAVVKGDFILSTRVRFDPAHQYDQAGLMVRVSPDCWLKTSCEYEPHEDSRLGAVVTNYGYSDWSTQDVPNTTQEIGLRVRRMGDDYVVEHRAGEGWVQLRMAHLHQSSGGPVQCGLYACSPIDAGYRAAFAYLKIEQPEERHL
jgi:regulation of enolase protein 1 (concanavalin A-like superfamily)